MKKKVIRLTESDVEKLVERILKEDKSKRLDEVGYDSPTIMGIHSGRLMGSIQNVIIQLKLFLQEMEQVLGGDKNELVMNISENMSLFGAVSEMLSKLSDEIGDDKLREETHRFISVLNQFVERARTLSNNSGAYTNKDFSGYMEKILIRLAVGLSRYGQTFIEEYKSITKKLKGHDRGDFN